jgi:predicted dehydrogenase
VRQYGLRADKMDAAARARLKDEVFGRHLQVRYVDGDRKGDQLTAELRHFIDCVRTGRTPRVTGEDGREAVAVAERILASVRCHEWEGRPDGAVGPNRMPRPAGWLFEVPKAEAA